MKKLILMAATAVALALSSNASASIAIYTNQADFLAAISSPGVDTFDDMPASLVNSPINRTAGAYGYTASAANHFYPAGPASDRWLSTNTATDSLVFHDFTGGVFGFGGFFFGSSFGGDFGSGGVIVSATDASGTVGYSVSDAQLDSFVGFVSTTGLSSASVAAVQPAVGHLWPTANDVILGGAAAVPEPTSWAMMIGGLGLAGAFIRRRRQAVRFA